MSANVDLIGNNGTTLGDVAAQFATHSKIDPNRMRPFIGKDGRAYFSVYTGGPVDKKESYKIILANADATLRKDEWQQLDDVVVRAKDYRLGGVADLISRGLTYQLGNAMGTTVLVWDDLQGDLTADMTMDAITRVQNNRPVWNRNAIPIPIIHADYEINLRQLETSRRMGNPLDTTMAERAVRAVNETLENLLFTNVTYSWGVKDDKNRNSIYSYVNFPDRHQITLANPWTDSGVTGKDIVDEIISWKQHSIEDRHYGPWMLYIPTAYETVLDEDYVGSNPDTNTATTLRARIMAISGILGIKVVDTLAPGNILMVQMTSDVVRLIQGLPLQNVEWSTEGRFMTKYKVLTIQVPQIRSDADGRCGVLHISAA